MGCAIPAGRLELVTNLAIWSQGHALFGYGRPADISAKPLQAQARLQGRRAFGELSRAVVEPRLPAAGRSGMSGQGILPSFGNGPLKLRLFR